MPDPDIEYFTHPPPMAMERLVAQIIGTTENARQASAEIDAVQDGRIPPLSIDIDPLTALVLASHLHIALETAPAGRSDRFLVEKFLDGLEAALAGSCPALVAVILAAYRRRKGGDTRG